jgi:hypothetical protein
MPPRESLLPALRKTPSPGTPTLSPNIWRKNIELDISHCFVLLFATVNISVMIFTVAIFAVAKYALERGQELCDQTRPSATG